VTAVANFAVRARSQGRHINRLDHDLRAQRNWHLMVADPVQWVDVERDLQADCGPVSGKSPGPRENTPSSKAWQYCAQPRCTFSAEVFATSCTWNKPGSDHHLATTPGAV